MISEELLKEIARAACVHPRSVQRRLLGFPVKGDAGRRIDAALEALRNGQLSTFVPSVRAGG